MDPVIHFQLPADDMKRMRDFYSKSFGWKTTEMGPEMGGYVTVMTVTSDKDGRPTKPGTINGGFYKRPSGIEGTMNPSIVIAVDDIKASMKKVLEAGGTTNMKEPETIPHVGLFMTFRDTEGNFAAMLQPEM